MDGIICDELLCFGAESKIGEEDIASFRKEGFGEGEVDSCSISQYLKSLGYGGVDTRAGSSDDRGFACKRQCHAFKS